MRVNPLYWIGWQYLRLVPMPREVCLEWRGRFVAPPGRVLVCFPEDYDSFLRAWRTVRDLDVDRGRLIFAARKPFLQAMGRPEGEKRISYEPEDINFFGLAKRRLLREAKKAHAAMGVDLHWGGIPLGAHLLIRSGAVVRAGLAETPNGKVYNLVLRTAPTSDYESAVAGLFQYLALVRGGISGEGREKLVEGSA